MVFECLPSMCRTQGSILVLKRKEKTKRNCFQLFLRICIFWISANSRIKILICVYVSVCMHGVCVCLCGVVCMHICVYRSKGMGIFLYFFLTYLLRYDFSANTELTH